ncbi:MAG TPA: CCA tRNA nucleotidyltransferase [Candidatus Acidoferrales bacterium]|nr:CCA tRNA nucleotidyltransferase [Candidatus Acidoferrales bacterium]
MDAHSLAEEICGKLRAAGRQAYLVGGCVRDILLGREPEDYDVATDAEPAEIQRLFPNNLAIGAQFGVIVVMQDSVQVEVATFRSDVGYSDGRHPDRVVYSKSPQEDAQRRDFTINALLLDPQNNREVLDFIGGRSDLREGIVRAIGDPARRFSEDKLRMMRAVRFAARFGYTIEPATLAAIEELAPEIRRVSAERVRDELTKILTEGAARRGFELLDQSRLLPEVLPEIARTKGVEQPPQFHPEGDVWTHTLLLLEKLPARAPVDLAWGALLHDVGKPPTFRAPSEPGGRIRFDEHAETGARMAEAICQRLRFSNSDTQQITALVANHMRFKDAPQMKPATLKRFVRLDRFEQHLELHRMDCLSSHGSLTIYDLVRRFLAETPAEEVRPAPLLTGDDLKELGLRPGPLFKEILGAVEDAQLNGRVRTRDEAVRLVRERLL